MSDGRVPSPQDIPPVEKPRMQLPESRMPGPEVVDDVGIALTQASDLIRVHDARKTFKVDGGGLAVAVLDTGLRTTHVDFAGRVPTQRNFTTDNGGNADDVSDGNGHGTNVGGIIVANGTHLGIAPGASIVPLKVLRNNGGGSFAAVDEALQWVLDHHREHNISVVCMSLGDSGNHTDDEVFPNDSIGAKVKALAGERIAVVVAAGNDFFTHGSAQGMGYPAIFRETISVGAVFDAREGPFQYSSGAATTESAPDRITPFSQRLHHTVNLQTRTDIFAPGAPIVSSGILSDQGESEQHGTSQATPVTAGVVLLLQEYYLRIAGQRPTVRQLARWLRRSGVRINDGDDEADNVANTGLDFLRIDALGALQAATRNYRERLVASLGDQPPTA